MSEKSAIGVSQIKKILFEDEQKNLQNIVGRVAELREQTNDLDARTDALYDRAGTDENLQRSVSEVLDGAIRDAEERDHRNLSTAMAPVVVKTIRTEITNQRDGMVQALYPITGRLVQTYVANAFRDFMAEVNQKLEGGLSLRHWGYRVKALFTGIPYRDLVLHNIRGISLQEIYLVKRGSGELIDCWEDETGTDLPTPESERKRLDGKKTMVSGFLTAITDFSREAFASDSTQLRTLDMQRDRIYLRASPAYLIAARCQGQAKPFMERALDEEFLRVLEKYDDTLSSPTADNDSGLHKNRLRSVLPDLAAGLQEHIRQREEDNRNRAPLAAFLLFLLGLSIFGWVAWQSWLHYQRTNLQSTVQAMIEADPVMRKYPTEINVTPNASAVTVFGLAPSFDARDGLMEDIRTALGTTRFRDEVAVLPGLKSQEELRVELAKVSKQVGQVETNIAVSAARDVVNTNQERATTTLTELQRMKADPTLAGEDDRLATLIASIQKIQSGFAEMKQRLSDAPSKDDLKSVSERIASLNARLDATESATEKLPLQAAVKKLNSKLTALAEKPAPAPVVVPPKPRVRDWITDHAIFFNSGTAFVNDALASKRLDELAALMKTDDVRLRLVGHTDGQGSRQANERLGLQRANKIKDELIARGITEDRMITLTRVDQVALATRTGDQSPNRRVEFEIAFRDEAIRPR